MRAGTTLSLSVILLVAHAARSAVPIPDPNSSTCVFPSGLLPCPEPVSVEITVRDVSFIPIVSCTTRVTIVVESGSLADGQVAWVEAPTGPVGEVTLTFEDGILGQGQIHLEVQTLGCSICWSDTYPLDCMAATDAGWAVSPARWGRIKARYR